MEYLHQHKESSSENALVLVVDDDRMVRLTIQVTIESFGYECLSAESGREALQILESSEVDLMITDLVMPEMGGMELLAIVREKYPDTDVMVATGYDDKSSYAEVIKAGAIDFVKKPIDLDELDAKLARVFRERDLIKSLELLSISDSLTGLYNRRAFNERFSFEVERAYRQGYQIFLAIIDIDNFKDYNDTYGHDGGDKVLVELAHIIQECTRHNVDICCRLGGDEFAVLLPETSASQATEIAQRILFRYANCSFGETTLSIGVVSCIRNAEVEQAEDEAAMKKKADNAMYDAKHSGKNCVICRA